MAEEETGKEEAPEESGEEPEEAKVEPGEEAKEVKKKKAKKVVRRRKSKKEKEKPITAAIRLAVESGKVGFGARTGIAASLLGKARLFVVASNAPSDTRQKVERYCGISGIPLLLFEGSSIELGSVCGKPFPVSVLSVYEPGASPILELAGK